MSLLELSARARMERLISLYIRENHLPFTMNSVTYGQFTYKKHLYAGAISYYSGVVYLQHKHSPVAMSLELSAIYNWWRWRNFKLLPAVYDYYTRAHPELAYPVNFESIPAKHMHGIIQLTRR